MARDRLPISLGSRLARRRQFEVRSACLVRPLQEAGQAGGEGGQKLGCRGARTTYLVKRDGRRVFFPVHGFSSKIYMMRNNNFGTKDGRGRGKFELEFASRRCGRENESPATKSFN